MELIRVHEMDNVAVALRPLTAGEELSLPWGGRISVRDAVPSSHKIALDDLTKGQTVYRYGQPIGTALQDIPQGRWVHTHNLGALESTTAGAAPAGSREAERRGAPATFPGYRRSKGLPGVRNYLLVLPTVSCANGVVRAIGRAFPQAVAIEHGSGCGRAGGDHQRTLRVLQGCGTHPNVAAVILVGLGCEGVRGDELAQRISESGRPVEYFEIQKVGGTRKCAEKGIQAARALWDKVPAHRREPRPLSELMLGLECGGSDALSGLTANPAVGFVSDRVVAAGGTVILSETTEMIGTTHLLQARAANPAVSKAIGAMIGKNEDLARRVLGDKAHLIIASGNMEGGLTTIAEKSLGCIAKGGCSTVEEVVTYAETPTRRGLVLMDTPGYDVESLGGMLAAGCQAMLFTTGRGSPVGSPLAPVVKVASNSDLWCRMPDDMDVNAGQIADGRKSLDELGEELWAYLGEVLAGKLTKAEENDQGVMGFSMTMEAF
jgi:altronate dehydratase large subunit